MAAIPNAYLHLLHASWLKKLGLSFLLTFAIGGNLLFAQVVADFSANTTSGCSPVVVLFTNTSTGGPFTSLFWDFGNGNTSTLANPGNIYSLPGTYTVSLTATGPGGTDTKTVVGYITVYRKPDVRIYADPITGCIPLTVNFADSSTSYPGPITSLIWDFGDGVTDITPNPSHTYGTPGTYDVLLSVIDNHGCAATVDTPTVITVLPPINANFSVSPTSGCAPPMTVNFTDLSTGPGPFTYSWDFGDGSPLDNAQNPSHVYAASGTYTVLLKITNAAGCISIFTIPNLVTVSPINAGFTALPLQGCVGVPVAFQDTSSGFPTGWAWDFGDGGTSNLQNPTHAYGATGFYNVQLTVTRAPGCSDTELRNNYIDIQPSPTAAFSALNTTACSAPLTVTFNQASVGAVSYLWDFGDGNTSTLAAPTHTYTSPGTYTVTLIATSANGCTNTLVQTNLVQIIPPVASFTFTGIQNGCMPRTIMFQNTSTTTFDVISGYDWDFGDGATSNGTNPNHTYTTAGSWTVTLIVYTAGGCSDTLTLPNFITTGPNPVANFSATPTTVCVGQTVSFTDLSNNATGWLWDFGDGGTSILQNPTHTYANLGTYTVTLVANNNGCTDTRVRNNYIDVVGTRASFTYAPTFACDTPATVTFTNTSTGGPLSLAWDFGDPASGLLNTATTPVASHIYHAFGNFTVKLVSTDIASGCKDSTTHIVRITKPNAAFSMNFSGFCAPLTTVFSNSSTTNAPPLTYQWAFGDLGTSPAANPVHQYITAGSYTPRLIVIDALGCRDTAFAAAPIVVHAAVANFTASTLATCPGTTINFNSTSTSDSPIVSQTWTFGDGSPAGSGVAVSHAYTNPGTYPVRLTVVDANGCSRTRVTNVVITRPMPNFTRVDTLLCVNEPFLFTNTSTPLPLGSLSYSWTFGDAGTSAAISPSHAYTANGNYTVQLVATDANGCKDSVSHPVHVQPPVANFVVSQSITNCPPLIVSDTNTSTGNIASYTWDFGDGSPVVNNNPTPSHIYNVPGSYAVTLIVRTPTGCADTLSLVAGAVVNVPTATYSIDSTVTCPGQPVQYVLNPPSTYISLWDFGDGQLLSGDTVMHAYSASGTFPIQLIVGYTVGNPCSTNAVPPLVNSVLVKPAPVAQIAWSDSLLCRADSVFFADSTTYGAGPINYAWDFGDGSTDSLADPSHFYAAPGTYTVSLFVTDSLGCSNGDTVNAAVRVFDHYPGFTVSPRVVCPNSPVSFIDTSFSDTGIATWAWDFGDGNAGTNANETHSYADTGWYDVTLIITTNSNCSDTVVLPNAVHVEIPTGTFTISTDTTCPMQPVQFTFLGGSWVTPTWYFGNGDSSTGADSVIYGYPNAGTFTATMGMVDTLGCRDTIAAPFPVTVMPGPMAAFAMDSTVFCGPDSVHFSDVSTYFSPFAGNAWTFGDGAGGIGQNVVHYYDSAGYYTVSLSVVDALGCRDSITDTNAVRIHFQTANFGASVAAGCIPTLVTFTDSSISDTNIVAWNWIFGDGGLGTGMNVGHSYIDTGYYDVTLVITTSVGCTDTLVLPNLIDIHVPQTPALWAATVEGDNQVAVVFHEDQSSLFNRYVLWGETGVGINYYVSTSAIRTDTILLDNASNSVATSVCYRPMVIDTCGDSTSLAQTTVHCTVELMAISGTDQNLLTWSPYVGWGNVARYDIFEVSDYDTTAVTFLASVAGNATNWVDNTLSCEQLRSYRIRAIGSVAQERSWSDTAAARPQHLPPTYIPEMVVATVANNADVQVEWDTAQFAGAGSYELFRSTDATTWNSLTTVPSGTLQYLDQAANVAAQSYYYHVTVADSCSYWSRPSGLARSILLQLDGSDGSVRLNWNPYENWGSGVTRYELEAMPLDGGPWNVLATLQPATLDYHDTQGLPNSPGVCYRVRAYENAGHQANSLSNEVCFTMDVWVPNTLTPNGDGFNDVLIVRALAGYPGTGIDIYNRWGNMVYTTPDYHNDWRGTNGNTGETLPDGVYYWVLHVSDGRLLKGFVNILR